MRRYNQRRARLLKFGLIYNSWTAYVFAVTVTLSSPLGAECVWEFAPSFPGGPRKGAAGLNHGGTLLAIGGRPFVGETAAVHHLPVGATGWQSGVTLEPAITQPGAGIDSLGRIVIFGGWIFDDTSGGFLPVINGFSYTVAGGPDQGIANMNCARSLFAFATDASNRFYAIGGLDINQVATDCVERYDAATDTWTPLAPLPAPRSSAAAVYDGLGHILVIGGSAIGGAEQSTVYSYDIALGTWSTVAPQPAFLARRGAALGADGLVYAIGGSNGGTDSAEVSIYDPATDQWSAGPSLTVARRSPAVALGNDGFIYAMGGYVGAGGGTNTVERIMTGPPVADCNANGLPDVCDPDCNANNVPDDCDVDPTDPDGDGLVSPDCNANTIPDECDPDDDGDGAINDCDNCPGVSNPTQLDTSLNGIGDACELTVVVELEGVDSPTTRTVDLVLTDCSNMTTEQFSASVDFNASGTGSVALAVSNLNAGWISADEGHVLRSLIPWTTLPPTSVSFTGVDRLTAGDFTGDGFIDVEDLSVLASRWNTPGDPADVNGDGVQETVDYTAVVINVFELSDPPDGCGP